MELVMKKKWYPLALLALGCTLFGLAQFLGSETGPEEVIGHIAGMFMFVGSIICIACGLLTFFMKDHEEEEFGR
jgi:hypothetical protein